jgi:hypothetical protein
MGVGVMRDETIKGRDLNSSHTLGCVVKHTVSVVVVTQEAGGLVRLARNLVVYYTR